MKKSDVKKSILLLEEQRGDTWTMTTILAEYRLSIARDCSEGLFLALQ